MADGSIDQLNFEVILKDNNFEQRLRALQSIAEAFNVSMSKALDISKVATGTKQVNELDKALKSAAEGAKNLNTNLKNMPVEKVTKYANETRNASTQMTNMKSVLSVVSQLTGTAFSVIGLRRFLSTLIDVTGQFEVQKMALRNMLQDADAADKIFQDLYDFSSRSTYRFSELAKYSKQLAAFNISKDSLLETTKMLGDVASGVGVSMDRLILAYGHVKSSGFLRGIQLRSFSQNGVPVLEELSKMLTEIEGKAVSLGDVFDKMTKREIPFEMVEEAFKRMTSEGGKFYQMQEVLAKTLAGQINILKGRWENMMYAIGQANDGFLKGVVGKLNDLVADYHNLGKVLAEMITIWGAYRVTVIATTLATEGLAVAINSSLIGRAFKGLASFFMANPLAAFAAGVTFLTFEIIKSTKALDDFEKITAAVTGGINEYSKAQAVEIEELDRLYTRLNLAKKGTEEYASAKRAITDRFGPYIEQLRQEGVEVNNLAGIYDNLAQKIEEANKSRFLESTTKHITDEFGNGVDFIEDRFDKLLNKIGKKLDVVEKETLWQFVLGKVDESVLRNMGIDNLINLQHPTANFTIGGLRDRYNKLSQTYRDEMSKAEEAFKVTVKNTTTESERELKDWEKSVKDALTSVADDTIKKVGLDIKENEDYYSYLKRIGKEFKEINEQKDKALKADKPQYEAWIAAIKKVDEALEGNILSDVRYSKTPWKASGEDDDEEIRNAISDLKTAVSILEKYKDAYERLEPILGDETQAKLETLFGKGVDYSSLDEQIQGIIESLRTLGQEGEEAADVIEARLGRDAVGGLVQSLQKTQKIAKTYRGLIEAWEAKDTDADDDTFFGKLTKIISDFNTKSNELFLKFKKSKEMLRGIDITDPAQKKAVIQGLMDEGMTEDAANEFWGTFVEKGETALAELYVKNLAKLKTSAQQSVNALASTWVKEQTRDMSLTDWGDKSIGQVRDLYKNLKKLAEGEGIDEKMKHQLAETGLAIEDFTKLTKEEFAKLSKDAKKELEKKVVAALAELASRLGSTAKAVKEFADASGKEGLSEVAEGMSEIADLAGNVLQGFQQGGWIGAVVAGVTSIATGMLQAATEAERFKRELAEAAEAARTVKFEQFLSSGVKSIFGTNTLKELNNAVDGLNQIKQAIIELNKITPDEIRQKNSFWYRFSYGFGHDNKYNRFSLQEMAKSIGREEDLFDKYNNLNADVLQAILEKYQNLKTSDKEWIDKAIHNSEMYAAAMEQLEGVMESVVGDMASSATDTIVDGWIEAKKAALDYVDILDDVAQSYAKMVIKSMILDEEEGILNSDAVKQLTQAFVSGDADEAMSLIEGKLQAIADLEPVFQQVLETFDPYFKREEQERTASSKAIASNFSQDTIDYWSGQLTLLVEFARRGDEQRENIANLVLAIKENMGGASGDGNYASNVQTYLAIIQGDTSAIRSDIYAMKLAIQNMNDKGVKML